MPAHNTVQSVRENQVQTLNHTTLDAWNPRKGIKNAIYKHYLLIYINIVYIYIYETGKCNPKLFNQINLEKPQKVMELA